MSKDSVLHQLNEMERDLRSFPPKSPYYAKILQEIADYKAKHGLFESVPLKRMKSTEEKKRRVKAI